MRNALSNDLRKRIIDDTKKGISRQDIAEKYNVHYNTVCRIIKLWKNTGDVEPRKMGGGRKSQLTEAQLSSIEQIIIERPDITILEIIEELKLPVAESWLSRIIVNKLKFRLKKNSTRLRTK